MSCRKLAISLAGDITSHPVSHRDRIYCSLFYGGPVLQQKDKLSLSPHWSFVLHKRTGLLVPVSRLETSRDALGRATLSCPLVMIYELH